MNTAQREAIERHGKNLLAIFPNATERDPVELCRKLRRIEAKGAAFALRLCNGPEFSSEAEQDAAHDRIIIAADILLGNTNENAKVPTFFNQDPRGYALKIDDAWLRERRELTIHRDWGGFGIIAPEINAKGA